jgi:hypothetical protein
MANARHRIATVKKKNPAAVALGRRGGQARAASLSPARLREIGQKGAAVRWAKAKRAKGKGGR